MTPEQLLRRLEARLAVAIAKGRKSLRRCPFCGCKAVLSDTFAPGCCGRGAREYRIECGSKKRCLMRVSTGTYKGSRHPQRWVYGEPGIHPHPDTIKSNIVAVKAAIRAWNRRPQ